MSNRVFQISLACKREMLQEVTCCCSGEIAGEKSSRRSHPHHTRLPPHVPTCRVHRAIAESQDLLSGGLTAEASFSKSPLLLHPTDHKTSERLADSLLAPHLFPNGSISVIHTAGLTKSTRNCFGVITKSDVSVQMRNCGRWGRTGLRR